MNQEGTDFKKLLTDVIQKQIAILGPEITLSKARKVTGLIVSDDGTVTNVLGFPQETTQNLIEQFFQLSGLIVKRAMEPILTNFPQTNPSIYPTFSPILTQAIPQAIQTQPAQPQRSPLQNPTPASPIEA